MSFNSTWVVGTELSHKYQHWPLRADGERRKRSLCALGLGREGEEREDGKSICARQREVPSAPFWEKSLLVYFPLISAFESKAHCLLSLNVSGNL